MLAVNLVVICLYYLLCAKSVKENALKRALRALLNVRFIMPHNYYTSNCVIEG